MKNYKSYIIVLLLTVHFFLLLGSAVYNTPTVDETNHLAQGIAILKTFDFRLNLPNPPLANIIGAIPLLFLDNLKVPLDSKYWKDAEFLPYKGGYDCFLGFGYEFVWKNNINPNKIIFTGRLALIVLSLFLGYLVYKWAELLYGQNAGLLALFFYVLSPNILAQANLTICDFVGACFIFVSAYFFWRYFQNPCLKNLILAGITLGLAQLGKVTALVLLYPAYVIIALLFIYKVKEFTPKFANLKPNRYSNIFLSVTLIFVISIVTLWAGYGFQLERRYSPLHRPHSDIDTFVNEYVGKFYHGDLEVLKNKAYSFMETTPLPLITYVRSVFAAIRVSSWGWHTNFLMGKHQQYGWWYYFPFAFLIKTPITTILIFLFLSIYYLGAKKIPWVKRNVVFEYPAQVKANKLFLDEIFILVVPLFLMLLSTRSKTNYGIKHILPIYPFLFVYAGKIINIIIEKNKWIKTAVLVILLSWYTGAAAFIYPHHLSYFNEFIGGPANGYKYLVDANIDWGQDLKGLRTYLDENNIKKIKLAYYGYFESPKYYLKGIEYEELACNEPTSGILAVSVTKLQGFYPPTKDYRRDCYTWLKKYEPIARIGYSIFIYDIP